MNAVTIREMSPGDVRVIAEIEKASYTMPWSETSFLGEVYSQHSITRVAELDGSIVAYVFIKQVADEGVLMNLTVHPDYRRQGIANMIFSNAIGRPAERMAAAFSFWRCAYRILLQKNCTRN